MNGGRINNLSREAIVATQGQIADPVKEGNTLLLWCKENASDCTEVYDPEENTTDVTELFAQWTVNSYAITFVFDNGESGPEVRVFKFGERIEYPEDLTKEGYTFSGWFPKPERMPARNLTVTAQWAEQTSELVEIVFEKKDLTREEIEAALKDYTDGEKFTIERIEADKDTGRTTVIVRFVDKQAAENFVEKIKASSGGMDGILDVKYFLGTFDSFSFALRPHTFIAAFML